MLKDAVLCTCGAFGGFMRLSSNIIRVYDAYGVKKAIELFAEAGFEAIDFNLDKEEFRDSGYGEEYYRDLADYARERGLAIGQAHAPFASSYPKKEDSERRFSEIVESIKQASCLGAPMIVVHPCMHLDCSLPGNEEALFEYNVDFYKKLLPYAKAVGIKIAVENIHISPITATPEKHIKLFDTLADPTFTVCFDVGHSFLAGADPADAIRMLGDRLVGGCIHVHDNMGKLDSHTLPFYGNIDWESVMRALAEIGYEGNLNYEAANFIAPLPVELYPEGLRYMASVGNYLIERFEYYKKELTEKQGQENGKV